MEIIPAIDIIDGKCVRLTKGDYDQKKIYNEHPLEVAKSFEGHGIKRLHLVDLDGAKAAHIVNYKVLEKIASQTGLHVDFGGGLKTDEDLRIAFESGAKQITGGSIAVKNPVTFEGWLSKYGGEKIILGADVHGKNIAVQGWTETSDQELIPFVKDYMTKGVKYSICTDIAKDGAMQGPSTDLYKEIRDELSELELIASGGVTTMSDLEDLDRAGCFGAIVGKAIYEGTIKLEDLEKVYFR